MVGRSRKCDSGEVEGVVDFREEEAALVSSIGDEAAEADSRPVFFPDEEGEEIEEDLGFRDVVTEIEGAAERCRREVTLVSVTLVGVTRLVGSATKRVLGRRGDFGVAIVGALVAFSTSLWGSVLAFTGRVSALIFE